MDSVFFLIGVVILVLILGFFMFRQYQKVGPNEILIISGGRKNFVTSPDGIQHEIGFKYRIGGGALVNPFTQRVERLPIEVIPVGAKIPEVLSRNGIPITAEFTAQVKIDTGDYSLYLAITNFLSRGTEGILEVSTTVLDSMVREVIGTFTVEDIFTKRNEFSNRVNEALRTDFSKMGLVL
ncbi:MAG: SPFH domain-containing protein, partial [Calditrichaceae bacterium]